MKAEITYIRNGKEFRSTLVMEDFDDIWEGVEKIAEYLTNCQYEIKGIAIYKQEGIKI